MPATRHGILLMMTLLAQAISLPFWNGCRSPLHHPPKPGQPAATVKFRIGHPYRPRGMLFRGRPASGVRLFSSLTIDGRVLPHEPVLGRVTATWTEVKPGWRTFRVESAYKRNYSVQVRQTYYETQTKPCSKYRCTTTYSMGQSHQSCGYHSATCTKQVRRERTVWQTRTQVLDRCAAQLTVATYNGATYLFTFEYLGPGSCSLTCHHQVFQPDGSFRLVPCRYVGR